MHSSRDRSSILRIRSYSRYLSYSAMHWMVVAAVAAYSYANGEVDGEEDGPYYCCFHWMGMDGAVAVAGLDAAEC